MRSVMLFLLIMVMCRSAYCYSNCYESEIGKEYRIIDATTIYMVEAIDRGWLGKDRGARLTVSSDTFFKIKAVAENEGSYLINVGYRDAFYMCSSLVADLKFNNIISTEENNSNKKLVGEKIWIKKEVVSFFYSDESLNMELVLPKRPIGAEITDFNKGPWKKFYYKVKFDNGLNGYIDKDTLYSCANNGYILTNQYDIDRARAEESAAQEAERIKELQRQQEVNLAEERQKKEQEIEQAEKQEALLKEQTSLINELKKNGIVKGASVWLKEPMLGMTGMTKLKIKDIYLRNEESGYGDYKYTNKYIVLLVEHNSLIESVEFPDIIENLADAFYTNNVGAKWGKKVLSAIQNGKVFIGMNKAQVIACWGRPIDINRTAGSWGIHEQWVYDGNYLYFENGVLRSWQD